MLMPPDQAGRPPAPITPTQLPTMPPKRASLFDKDHRQQSLLAIASGLLSSRNFGEGLGGAAQNLFGLQQNLRQEGRQRHEFGGPDDAFEIITDPQTGARTVKDVPVFQDYLSKKRVKAKDTADLNGRAMFALSKLPEADRPAVYSAMLANPEQYGIDPDTMPEQYDPRYTTVAGQMGMTVAQAQTRDQARDNSDATAAYRKEVQADRTARTGIFRERAAATTAQGEARIGIARTKALPKAKPAGKGRGKTSSKNDDLSYLLK